MLIEPRRMFQVIFLLGTSQFYDVEESEATCHLEDGFDRASGYPNIRRNRIINDRSNHLHLHLLDSLFALVR